MNGKWAGSSNIRPAYPEDAQSIKEIVAHPAVGYGTNQLPSQEQATTSEWLQHKFLRVYRFSAVAQNENGSSKIVGNLTLHQHQKPRLGHTAWFGMTVPPHYWGIGVGSNLVESALNLADKWLGLRRVELEVQADNTNAIHLYEKSGFKIEGTKRLYSFGAGRWADAHLMARMASTMDQSTG